MEDLVEHLNEYHQEHIDALKNVIESLRVVSAARKELLRRVVMDPDRKELVEALAKRFAEEDAQRIDGEAA